MAFCTSSAQDHLMSRIHLPDDPFFDIARFVAEVHADLEEFAIVMCERQCILLVFYLLERFFGSTFQFEFHNVDILVRLEQQIDATFGSMIFCLDIEPDQFEDDEEHILIMQFQIFHQFVWRVGKEALQTAEECVDFSVFHFLNKFRYLEIRFHTINR